MKTFTTRRLCAVIVLACASLALYACSSQSDTLTTPTPNGAAPGPNANLSNADLLAKAVANMKALDSYHFEEKGGNPGDSFWKSPDASIVGDIESGGKANRISLSEGSNRAESLVTPDGHYYESYDGGKTWQQPSDSVIATLEIALGPLWDDFGNGGTSGDYMLRGLTMKDANPASEEMDGVYTKRMTAAASVPGATSSSGLSQLANGAKSVDIWVSTDITPTIRQMRINGSTSVLMNEVGAANSAAFSPDGKTLAVAHEDSMVRVWDLTKPSTAPTKLKSDHGSFMSVAFSPDGKTIAAGLYGDNSSGAVYLWDANNLTAAPITLTTGSNVRSVAFRPDGKMLAAGADNGVFLWAPPYMGVKPTVIAYAAGNNVDVIAFSPDNHTLATGDSQDGVRLYDTNHPEVAPTTFPGAWVPGVAFSPDGHLFAATGGLRLWDLGKPGSAPTTLPEKNDGYDLMTVAFSPDGQKLAVNRASSGSDGSIQIWSLSNLAAPSALLGNNQVSSIAFSPDSKTLAAAIESPGEVELWDLQNPAAKSTPTILKEDEQPTDTPYTLTWNWSRFNEDLGEVKAPPTEAVK